MRIVAIILLCFLGVAGYSQVDPEQIYQAPGRDYVLLSTDTLNSSYPINGIYVPTLLKDSLYIKGDSLCHVIIGDGRPDPCVLLPEGGGGGGPGDTSYYWIVQINGGSPDSIVLAEVLNFQDGDIETWSYDGVNLSLDVDVSGVNTDDQQLSISTDGQIDTIFLEDGGFVVLHDSVGTGGSGENDTYIDSLRIQNDTLLGPDTLWAYRDSSGFLVDSVFVSLQGIDTWIDTAVVNTVGLLDSIWFYRTDTVSGGYIDSFLVVLNDSVGVDLNFAHNNLTADGNRFHEWAGFDLFVSNADDIIFGGDDIQLFAGDDIDLNALGDLIITQPVPNDNTQNHILVRDSVSGRVEYRDVSSIIGDTDTNFAEDNLSADGNRTHDWNQFDLTINDGDQFTLDFDDIDIDAVNQIDLFGNDINISAPDVFLAFPLTLNNSATAILVRNSSTGEIQRRNLSSINPDTYADSARIVEGGLNDTLWIYRDSASVLIDSFYTVLNDSVSTAFPDTYIDSVRQVVDIQEDTIWLYRDSSGLLIDSLMFVLNDSVRTWNLQDSGVVFWNGDIGDFDTDRPGLRYAKDGDALGIHRGIWSVGGDESPGGNYAKLSIGGTVFVGRDTVAPGATRIFMQAHDTLNHSTDYNWLLYATDDEWMIWEPSHGEDGNNDPVFRADTTGLITFDYYEHQPEKFLYGPTDDGFIIYGQNGLRQMPFDSLPKIDQSGDYDFRLLTHNDTLEYPAKDYLPEDSTHLDSLVYRPGPVRIGNFRYAEPYDRDVNVRLRNDSAQILLQLYGEQSAIDIYNNADPYIHFRHAYGDWYHTLWDDMFSENPPPPRYEIGNIGPGNNGSPDTTRRTIFAIDAYSDTMSMRIIDDYWMGSIYTEDRNRDTTSVATMLSGGIAAFDDLGRVVIMSGDTLNEYLNVVASAPQEFLFIGAIGEDSIGYLLENTTDTFNIARADIAYNFFSHNMTMTDGRLHDADGNTIQIIDLDNFTLQGNTTNLSTNVIKMDLLSELATDTLIVMDGNDELHYMIASGLGADSLGQVFPDKELVLGNGSTTGGQSFPHLTWEESANGLVIDSEGDGISSGGYTWIRDASSTQMKFEKAGAGNTLIDINPLPTDGSSSATFRFFRETSTSGITRFDVFLGDGSSTINTRFGGQGINSYIAANNGNVGIGTSSVSAKLNVNGTVRLDNLGTPDEVTNILYVDDDNDVGEISVDDLETAMGGPFLTTINLWASGSNVADLDNDNEDLAFRATSGGGLELTGITTGGGYEFRYGIATGGVTSAFILDGTVTGTDIANGTITSTDIASNTITGGNILNGTITGTDIATGTVTGTNILDGTVASADIANGTIVAADIAGTVGFDLSANSEGSPTHIGMDTDEVVNFASSGSGLSVARSGNTITYTLSGGGSDGNGLWSSSNSGTTMPSDMDALVNTTMNFTLGGSETFRVRDGAAPYMYVFAGAGLSQYTGEVGANFGEYNESLTASDDAGSNRNRIYDTGLGAGSMFFINDVTGEIGIEASVGGRDISLDANGDIFIQADNNLEITTGSGDDVIVLSGGGTSRYGIWRNPISNELEVNGTASKSAAGDWLANSDERLKKNITQLDGKESLDKLLNLRGVNFEWNDTATTYNRPEGVQWGFIAQDILKSFEGHDQFVSMDNEGYYQAAYGTYDPLYVESFRYHQSEIELLKAENQAQKNQIDQLYRMVERLIKQQKQH